RLYQIFSRPDFLGAFQVPALAFPFPAVPTLSDAFGIRFPVGGIRRPTLGFRLSAFRHSLR
ncbi:hypothetical protein, partial [Streptomyces sp. NPDC058145]|uniref:hypothetical protein n=1 Tax=Streptomyces sp. NPDC058145 TaxID=3346356 RepID=UPI0036EAD1A5